VTASRVATLVLVPVAAVATLSACGGGSDHRSASSAATKAPPASSANPPMRIPPQGTPEFKRWHERRLRILKKAFREAHNSAVPAGASSP
jgi:hypothetical protein